LAEQLNRVELLRLARLGATSRLEELRREIVSLETLLGGDAPRVKRRVKRRKAAKVAKAAAAEAPAPHKTAAAWSPAARRAVSLRMKKYWAARRQAKKR
jgi:hypothetical protein